MALEPSVVHVWRVPLEPAVVPGWRDLVTAEELQRAAAFRREEHGQGFLLARAALRVVLSGYVGVAPGGLTFSRVCVFCGGPHGKPRLVAPPEAAEVRFNMSHSDDFAVVAVARGREVGVDVERIKPGFDYEGVVKDFFTPEEQARVARAGPGEKERAFFEAWTRKEAVLKLQGLGIAGEYPPQAPSQDRPIAVHALHVPPGFVGALAVEGDPVRLVYRDLGPGVTPRPSTG